jgi:hypothetical protein
MVRGRYGLCPPGLIRIREITPLFVQGAVTAVRLRAITAHDVPVCEIH